MMSGWGFCESPLVDGDKLVCTPGGDEAAIVALNKRTGEVLWKSIVPALGGRGKDGAAYCSMMAADLGGTRQYIQMIGRGIVGVAADDGTFLWGYNRIANHAANTANPIVKDPYVFCSTGYGTGSALLTCDAAQPTTHPQEVYFLPPDQFENHHGGVVFVDGYIYGGHGMNRGGPICINFGSGEIKWKEEPVGGGSAAVIYADGHVYFRYEKGEVVLIEATPEQYKLKGIFKPEGGDGPAWAHPTISDGKLYLRRADVLMCYDISASPM